MPEMFIHDDADACLSVSLDTKANWWLACYMEEIGYTHYDERKKHDSCDQIEENCHDFALCICELSHRLAEKELG